MLLIAAAVAAPILTPPDPMQVEIVMGIDHACTRRVDGRVQCWGADREGELGVGQRGKSQTPLEVLRGAKDLDAGPNHTCAVLQSGRAACWGVGTSGQLGQGVARSEERPVDVKELTGLVAVGAGDHHTCAVRENGGLFCWGDNLYGQLGRTDIRSAPSAVSVADVESVRQVVAGSRHACALGASGAVWCWGDNEFGQTGHDAITPAEVPGISGAIGLSAWGHRTCAVTSNGHAMCWGEGFAGQQPIDTREASAVAVGTDHVCAIESGRVRCWGDNSQGQLGGLGETEYVSKAWSIGAARSLAAGDRETCALDANGQAACWGRFTSGESDAARAWTVPARNASKVPMAPRAVTHHLLIEEQLSPTGSQVQIGLSTHETFACRTDLDVGAVLDKRRLVLDVRGVRTPPGACQPQDPERASYLFALPLEWRGAVEVRVRVDGKTDKYRVVVKPDKVEVWPVVETFAWFDREKILKRVPVGGVRIACAFQGTEPMCQRRLAEGSATCVEVENDPLFVGLSSLGRADFASERWAGESWAPRYLTDGNAEELISKLRRAYGDSTGCLDVRVYGWTGDTWTNGSL